MSSLENVKPGMRPLFFNQKMAQKAPEKKIPSTAANATSRSAKAALDPMYRWAHFAFFSTDGTDVCALKSISRSFGSVI